MAKPDHIAAVAAWASKHAPVSEPPEATASLLGGPVDPTVKEKMRPEEIEAEQQAAAARFELESQAQEAARLILDYLFGGYGRGEMSFEDFCRRAHRVLAAPDVPPLLRRHWLGDYVAAALPLSPQKLLPGQRRRPDWLSELCSDMCTIANKRDGLPLVRKAKGKTAFERVAEILRMRGMLEVTATTVEKARTEWRKHTASG